MKFEIIKHWGLSIQDLYKDLEWRVQNNNYCVFWPAFRCYLQPEAGQNSFWPFSSFNLEPHSDFMSKSVLAQNHYNWSVSWGHGWQLLRLHHRNISRIYSRCVSNHSNSWPYRYLNHRGRKSLVMRSLLYLQATTAGSL